MEEDVLILLGVAFNLNLPLLTAWLLDHWLGDPAWLPHPVVAFGKAISFCEHRLNRGDSRFLKGALMTVLLVAGVYFVTLLLLRLAALFSPGMLLTVQILLIFYCLAGTTPAVPRIGDTIACCLPFSGSKGGPSVLLSVFPA